MVKRKATVEPAHAIDYVSRCSTSWYVECTCGEKVYGETEDEARAGYERHTSNVVCNVTRDRQCALSEPCPNNDQRACVWESPV